MVSLIKNATGCKIIVGQNGVVWLQGEPMSEVIAIQAIKKIEEESHISGLTERVTEFLEKSCGKIEPRETLEEQNDEQNGEMQEQEQQEQ